MSLDATTDMLPDKTTRPSTPLPDANLHNNKQTPENIISTTHESKESKHVDLDTNEPVKPLDTEWQEEITTDLMENTEIDTTRETVIGEITFTETDTTMSNTNDNKESKDNLTLGDIPQGISDMHPVETSSVISEPTEEGAVVESTPSTSISTSLSSFNKLTPIMNKEETQLAKKNRLKWCIIKLTELSNSDREKWLSGETSSSRSNRTTESIESSDSSRSRYNMRSRPNSTHKHPVRTTRPKINYTEHGIKDSSCDSDFEPVLKPPTPLDNKSHPTPSRIAMQKEIELNKATKRNHTTAFPDKSQLPNKNNKATGVVNKAVKPNVPNTPRSHLPVQDATNTPMTNELPEATQNMLPDIMDKDKDLPDTTDKNTMENGKPTKGVFKTKQISHRRSKDPCTFKCSKCDTRTSSLKELNALFIETHCQVNCDICGKVFNTPGSLRKHRYSHVEEDSQYKCRSCDKMFQFESQLKSHRHMHRHSRNYICASANCGKSFKHPGDLSAHAKSHGKPHKCVHCDYENTDMRNLKSHQRTHSRVAIFKCKLCRECFVHSNQLLRHRPKCPKSIKKESTTD